MHRPWPFITTLFWRGRREPRQPAGRQAEDDDERGGGDEGRGLNERQRYEQAGEKGGRMRLSALISERKDLGTASLGASSFLALIKGQRRDWKEREREEEEDDGNNAGGGSCANWRCTPQPAAAPSRPTDGNIWENCRGNNERDFLQQIARRRNPATDQKRTRATDLRTDDQSEGGRNERETHGKGGKGRRKVGYSKGEEVAATPSAFVMLPSEGRRRPEARTQKESLPRERPPPSRGGATGRRSRGRRRRRGVRK